MAVFTNFAATLARQPSAGPLAPRSNYQVVLFKKYLNLIHFLPFSGLFFHVVGEGVVNLSRKAENFTDKENYIDFRLRLLGEPGKKTLCTLLSFSKLHCCSTIVKENWSIVVI